MTKSLLSVKAWANLIEYENAKGVTASRPYFNTLVMLDEYIRKVAEGDYAAFKHVHDLFAKRVFYFAYKLSGGNQEMSDDAVQDAFILYWEKRSAFTSVLAVKGFLYTTVQNKVLKQLWQEKNRRRLLNEMEWEEAVDEEYEMMTAEICAEVNAAVKKLPPQTKLVIELSMQDMTVEEIASALHVSSNTIKSLKKSGYKLLREQLGHLKFFLLFLF